MFLCVCEPTGTMLVTVPVLQVKGLRLKETKFMNLQPGLARAPPSRELPCLGPRGLLCGLSSGSSPPPTHTHPPSPSPLLPAWGGGGGAAGGWLP